MILRNTYAEINLGSVKNNIQVVKNYAPSCKILFAVKADAYGHGMSEIAGFAEKNKLVDYFGVSSIEEGIELRESGIISPVLILGLTLPEDKNLSCILQYHLIPSVAEIKFIDLLNRACCQKETRCSVHIKTDTGMGRIGCIPADVPEIAAFALNCTNIDLEGLFSHMPVSDDISSDFNVHQISLFRNLIDDLERRKINIPIKHLANSAAILNYRDSHFDMVRPGIICYGYRPDFKMPSDSGIVPSMTLKSQVVFTKYVKQGTGLSYGHIYETTENCFISTIPIGYGDGYNRSFSNKGKIIINGKSYPVVGRVCMDQLLVNTGNERFEPGTEVYVFDNNHFTVDDAAHSINTISYEITCGISRRVPRIYSNTFI